MASRKSSKPKNIIAVTDFWGNPVSCTAKQWIGHVLDPVEGHPEMIGREHDVAKILQDPDVIRPSTKTGKAFAFESVSTSETVRAIVYYQDAATVQAGRTYGTVATAYVDNPAFVSQVGLPIYRKPASKKGGDT